MKAATSFPQGPAVSATDLLAWYDRHARQMPWRTPPDPGGTARPDSAYRVWLSEIMLQQTTVKTVAPYFVDFLERWPTIDDLAAAGLDQVLRRWAGLGYYTRARNLHRCAQVVGSRGDRAFPSTAAELQALPGIGPYTAAAIAAIAFGQRIAVVDGNVERVGARVIGLNRPVREAKPELHKFVQGLVPADRPGDFAQAIMDLGATVCTPRQPDCQRCPWSDPCSARRTGQTDEIPVKVKKKPKPTRRGVAFVARRGDGAVLLRQRPATGLLGGMTEVPGSPWSTEFDPGTWLDHVPFETAWTGGNPAVRHTFTHFRLTLDIYQGAAPKAFMCPPGWWFSRPEDLPGEALPSLMRKVLAAALAIG